MDRNSNRKVSRTKTLWHQLAEEIQLPGVSVLFNAVNAIERLLWVAFFCICFLFTAYALGKVISEYVEEPTVTKVIMKQKHDRNLPDMEMCIPFDLNNFIVKGKQDCLASIEPPEMATKFIESFNNSDQFDELMTHDFVVRGLIANWIQEFNELEFFKRKTENDLETEANKIAFHTKRGTLPPSSENLRYEATVTPRNDNISVTEYDETSKRAYMMIDEHLNKCGVTVEHAFKSFADELLRFFEPHLLSQLGTMRHRWYEEKEFFPLRLTKRPDQALCTRLLMDVFRSHSEWRWVRLEVNNNETQHRVPPCGGTTKGQSEALPSAFQLRVQPYASDLAAVLNEPLVGRHNKRQLARLYIESEQMLITGEGCSDAIAEDQDFCRLNCRYQFILNRCQCRPVLIYNATRQFKPRTAKNKNIFHMRERHYGGKNKETRECRLSDYYGRGCYNFTQPELEDNCIRKCLPKCTYLLFRTEPKVTWFNVISDIGGALGLCMGLSVFTIIHTMVLPLRHLVMPNQPVSRPVSRPVSADLMPNDRINIELLQQRNRTDV